MAVQVQCPPHFPPQLWSPGLPALSFSQQCDEPLFSQQDFSGTCCFAAGCSCTTSLQPESPQAYTCPGAQAAANKKRRNKLQGYFTKRGVLTSKYNVIIDYLLHYRFCFGIDSKFLQGHAISFSDPFLRNEKQCETRTDSQYS